MSLIGRSLPRHEDAALLRGAGRFTDDAVPPGCAELVFVRSDHAAGRIVTVETTRARAMPGVLAVIGAADLAALGVGHLAPARLPQTVDGRVHVPPFPPLADGAVHHAGQAVVAVLAETRAIAHAAAEAVTLDIAAEDPVTDLATARGARPVWPGCLSNVVFRHEIGDASAVAHAMAAAAHVVRARLAISRVTAMTLEPRGAIGLWDGAGYTLHAGTQAPHGLAQGMARLMGLDPGAVRVVSRNCGGSFGMRNAPAPELAVVLAAARLSGRPVRWIATRSEAFLSDPQAREQIVDAALALDADGRFLALSVDAAVAVGALVGPATLHPATGNLPSLAGVYRIPAIHAGVDGVHLNTQSVAPYRGAGRPEASYVTERMIDIAAARLGFDRVDLRRRNMLRAADLPHRTPLGFTYDSGDFQGVMDRALDAADWAGFPARRAEAAARGQLRGIGLACTIEIAGGPVAAPGPEYARVDLSPEGCTLRMGTGDAGQGHATTFAQIAATVLGIAPDAVTLVAGDTGTVDRGTGTFGSRSVAAAGSALLHAAAEIADRLRAEAAVVLGVAPDAVTLADGLFRAPGTNRTVAPFDLVRARDLHLGAERWEATPAATYPNGCHVAEVEIDPETGATGILRYVAVEDFGTVVNPLLAEGQVHGGAAQGIGQALSEAIRVDPGSGSPLTGSLMDYAVPRAADLPTFTTLTAPTKTRANALGAKGAGEAGCVGALPCVASAVADALAPLGIVHVDMPATPLAIWSAIRAARAAATSSAAC
ncbi:MAG: xanthine dehydrogenase family protein molybdopterin-binding subunit [Rhodobacteraceae bacterium]|jgi:carbon-monoxide dehydrogenase large subunit|nr:xanthine dehydrogenase family protein molybdopterin-binding subunit [Paracoccaceae bacterium]